MSWTKKQIIEQAFEELGLASYVYDLSPEQLQNGLRRLDTMMQTWIGLGINLGYPVPTSLVPTSLSQDSLLPDYAVEAVYLKLAIKLAPSIGKQISQDTYASAKRAYDIMLITEVGPTPEQIMPCSMPYGAGNKNIDEQFFD